MEQLPAHHINKQTNKQTNKQDIHISVILIIALNTSECLKTFSVQVLNVDKECAVNVLKHIIINLYQETVSAVII